MRLNNFVFSLGSCGCDKNAHCRLNHQSRRGPICKCNWGFAGDGKNCYDIDECAHGRVKCHHNAECINTEGSYECKCKCRVANFTVRKDSFFYNY